MKITDRDIEILRFINDHGFCITPHLERRFKIKNWRVYQLMKRLVGANFVRSESIFKGRPNFYYLTKEGAAFTDLPAIPKINLGIYEHQITLIDVAFSLSDTYPSSKWISERKLKYDKFFAGLGSRGHIADGMLVLDDERNIYIEVELSLKSINRLESILKTYTRELSIKDEVWYFCAPSIISAITKLIGKKSFIKVYCLKDFLNA